MLHSARSSNHTKLAKMSFEETFDLTAEMFKKKYFSNNQGLLGLSTLQGGGHHIERPKIGECDFIERP